MSASKTIAIVFHETTTQDQMSRYRIWRCAQAWEQMGFSVKMLRWEHKPIEADLLIPQIDLSVLPRKYRQLFSSRSAVANRTVVDIRKSVFSRQLVTVKDAYHGPVIVKTNANYGGYPEWKCYQGLSRNRRRLERVRWLSRKIARTIASGSLAPLARTITLDPKHYPVFSSKHELPRGVFKNPDLVVERFLPEREGRYYILRSYSFLGSAGVSVRTRSESQVVKGANGTDLEFIPVDVALVTIRKEMGFDYGKFDYVIYDGKVVLLDVNYTPTFAGYPTEVRSQITRQLATGIAEWFPELSSDRSPSN
jgi:hypothetical protein